MNQQLLVYIRENLLNGASETQIRQVLINSGWKQYDRDNAFSSLNEKKKKTINPWIPIVVLLLALGGGTGYLFLNVLGQATPSAGSSTINSFLDQEAVSGCDTDMKCFIRAASTCLESDVLFISSIDFFGMVVTTTINYEIKGMQQNRCILLIEMEDQQFEFSEQAKQNALANGMTENDLNFQIQEANRASQSLIGKEGLCKFRSNSELANLMAKLNAGSSTGETTCTLNAQGADCTSTGDWAVAECSGELFYPPVQ